MFTRDICKGKGMCWHNITNKEESVQPLSLETMMISYAINIKENKYFVVTDIPGAFLHTYMEQW